MELGANPYVPRPRLTNGVPAEFRLRAQEAADYFYTEFLVFGQGARVL